MWTCCGNAAGWYNNGRPFPATGVPVVHNPCLFGKQALLRSKSVDVIKLRFLIFIHRHLWQVCIIQRPFMRYNVNWLKLNRSARFHHRCIIVLVRKKTNSLDNLKKGRLKDSNCCLIQQNNKVIVLRNVIQLTTFFGRVFLHKDFFAFGLWCVIQVAQNFRLSYQPFHNRLYKYLHNHAIMCVLCFSIRSGIFVTGITGNTIYWTM